MNEIFYDPALAELRHYGMPRRSGRYPWGSGKDPYQHTPRGFVERVTELRKSGMLDKEIRMANTAPPYLGLGIHKPIKSFTQKK